MGRFINADALASTGQGLLGNNMFAYCNNNPILNVDKNGNFPNGISNPNAILYGYSDSNVITVKIQVTKYSNNPIINDACEDVAKNVSSYIDDVANIINAQNFGDVKDAAIGILQNDITQDIKGIKRISSGANSIAKGVTMIFVFPDPTFGDEALGAAKFVSGFINVIKGICEILEWG